MPDISSLSKIKSFKCQYNNFDSEDCLDIQEVGAMGLDEFTWNPQADNSVLDCSVVTGGDYSYIIPHIPPSNSGWTSNIILFNPTNYNAFIFLDIFELQNGFFSKSEMTSQFFHPKQIISLDAITNQSAGQRWIGIRSDKDLVGEFSFALNRGLGEEKTTLPIVTNGTRSRPIGFSIHP